MKKIIFAILSLLISCDVFAQTGGFPSRPKFLSATIKGNSVSDGLTQQNISANAVRSWQYISDGGTDAKYWLTYATPTEYGIAVCTDANKNTCPSIPLTIGRSGLTGTYVNILGLPAATIESGSFNMTLFGCSSSPGYTVNWQKIGKLVTLRFGGGGCTSNSTGFSLSGTLPASIAQATAVYMPVKGCVDASTSNVDCSATISSAGGGLITFFKNGASGGWTASGTKGFIGPPEYTTVNYLMQ